MPDEKKPSPAPSPPNPPQRLLAHETWSAICPNDLGLKAGYRVGDKDPITFKDIVGWSTVMRTFVSLGIGAMPPEPAMLAVVINDGVPAAARGLPGFVGTFDKTASPEEALATFLARKARADHQAPLTGDTMN